jgi:hypothetical protein
MMGGKPGQGKGQGRASGRKARGKKTRADAPGIIESWEDFNQLAMRDYLYAVIEDLAQELDELERALRSEN